MLCTYTYHPQYILCEKQSVSLKINLKARRMKGKRRELKKLMTTKQEDTFIPPNGLRI